MDTKLAPTSFADRVDQLLNRHRNALLDIARSRRAERDALLRPRSNPDPTLPGAIGRFRSQMPRPNPESDPIGAAQDELAKFYAKGIAKSIEDLVQLIDDIRDRRRRLKAMDNIGMLITCVSGEALNCRESPIEKLRTSWRMEGARLTNAQRVDQRRELLRPLVAAMASKFPSEGAAKIAARLRKRKNFEAQFGAKRRTLEADVAFLLSPSEPE